ncbi:reverse transcriptase domain-containing protein, partial [Streptococcus dysgalactiae]|uniref:reverse transcriptase domain-containing protein n=1 Tax=Streptococcus dysgalactiae TaxID=1334 RepID=UPI00194EA149
MMFNRCIVEGKIADGWRPVRITPVPKKETGKFRPIACTSLLLKVLEKLVLGRINSYANLDDIYQFAYCKKRSTLDALSLLVHSVLSNLDSTGKAFRMCFLDYSNAFNSVNRAQLLSDLEETGLPHRLLCWIHDYFRERYQYTSLNGQNSSMLPIDSGVLQGAILSPFLFSFYIRYLPTNPDILSVKYADDVTVGSRSDENFQ